VVAAYLGSAAAEVAPATLEAAAVAAQDAIGEGDR
jgi:hypothetical protein